MPEISIDNSEFKHLLTQVLAAGSELTFRAKGESMRPFIDDGDALTIRLVAAEETRVGDVVLYESETGRILAHRVIKTTGRHDQRLLLVQGDALPNPDGWIRPEQVLGKANRLGTKNRWYLANPAIHRLLVWLWLMPITRRIYYMLAALKSGIR